MCRPDYKHYDTMDSISDNGQTYDEEAGANTGLQAPSTTSALWLDDLRNYLSSNDMVEVCCCLFFYGLVHAIFMVGGFTVHLRPMPVQQVDDNLYIENQQFGYEYQGETVPGEYNKYFLMVPLLVQLFLSLILPSLRNNRDWHKTLCVYVVSSALCDGITQAIKLYVGYFRPVFFSLCQPSEDYSECTTGGHGPRTSFPSSHSSMSFVNAVLLMLFLHCKFGIPTQRRYVKVCDANDDIYYQPVYTQTSMRARFCTLLSILPVLWATFVACSRVVDNMHAPVDILAGCVIGSSIAYGVHNMWFAY